MRDINTLRLFIRVARLGSFSAAARESGLSQSRASRMVTELEAELGVRLLSRTTRAVVPTDAGSIFLTRLEPLLSGIEELADDVRDDGELRGLVRISMPTSVGLREIVPRLATFRARHPKLNLEIIMEDRRQDLVREAVDVAIRVGQLQDSSATARQIKLLSRVITASPAYLEAAGIPNHPDQLSGHAIVAGPAARVPPAWVFERQGVAVSPAITPVVLTNDNEGAIAAAVAGMGIASTSNWSCRRELADGTLVQLFADWEMAKIPVYAYYPMGRATRRAARALIDHLERELSTLPESSTLAA